MYHINFASLDWQKTKLKPRHRHFNITRCKPPMSSDVIYFTMHSQNNMKNININLVFYLSWTNEFTTFGDFEVAEKLYEQRYNRTCARFQLLCLYNAYNAGYWCKYHVISSFFDGNLCIGTSSPTMNSSLEIQQMPQSVPTKIRAYTTSKEENQKYN